jgi:hypothetical protein
MYKITEVYFPKSYSNQKIKQFVGLLGMKLKLNDIYTTPYDNTHNAFIVRSNDYTDRLLDVPLGKNGIIISIGKIRQIGGSMYYY